MVAVVSEVVAGLDDRFLIHHAVSFDDDPIAVALMNDPFAPEDAHFLMGAVDDRDKVDEWVGAVLRCLQVGHVDDIIHFHSESLDFFKAIIKFRHELQLFQLVNMARTQSTRNFLDDENFIVSESPIVLTIAGSDSCGGAGIQADLKVFTQMGVYGMTVVTAVVAESAHEVRLVESVSDAMLQAQLEVILGTYPIAAVKTGMISDEAQVAMIADQLEAWKLRNPMGQLVVDPVVQSSSGTRLMAAGAVKVLQTRLLPLADLVTPNLGEAALLLDGMEPEVPGLALMERFGTNFLVKGGHSEDPAVSADILYSIEGITSFEAARLPSGHRLHGTGCTLSAAIAAFLARGSCLEDAVAQAKSYLTSAMTSPHDWGNALHALKIGRLLDERP